jgi:hypothetical protein
MAAARAAAATELGVGLGQQCWHIATPISREWGDWQIGTTYNR